MNFLLVFENSGDALPFVSINTDVLEYYVDSLNQLGINKFLIDQSVSTLVDQNIKSLDSVIQQFNELPVRHIINVDLNRQQGTGYLDQQYLNQLHADWVAFQRQNYHIRGQCLKHNFSPITKAICEFYPDDEPVVRVGNVLQKLKLKREFDNINFYIHELESRFNYVRACADTDEWIEIPNPFDKKLLTNNVANLTIDFNHLGRTLYDKFKNFDSTFKYNDENSYNELLKNVAIKLRPPETIPLSKEYVSACQATGREPKGNFLNIGNLIDLDKRLTEYRQIVYKNTLAKNKFSFELTKE